VLGIACFSAGPVGVQDLLMVVAEIKPYYKGLYAFELAVGGGREHVWHGCMLCMK